VKFLKREKEKEKRKKKGAGSIHRLHDGLWRGLRVMGRLHDD
jgi:hypothetical protein